MSRKLIFLLVLLLIISGCSKESSNNKNSGSKPEIVEDVKNTITFGDEIDSNGSGFSIDETVVTIHQAGNYYLSGESLNGRIIIDTTGSVTLYLDNLILSSSTGPVIDFIQTSDANIFLVSESENRLSTSGKHSIIHSAPSLVLEGNGKLFLDAPTSHAIHGEQHLTINGGYYEINSLEYGLYVSGENKSVIVMQSGYLFIKSDSDAIHSKGSMLIQDGTILAIGASTAYGIYCEDPFQIDGGILVATGKENTLPLSNSAQYVINTKSNVAITSGTQISAITNKNELIVSYTSLHAHNNFLFSSSKLIGNEHYFIYLNGTIESSKITNGLSLSGSYAPGSLIDTIKPDDLFKGE